MSSENNFNYWGVCSQCSNEGKIGGCLGCGRWKKITEKEVDGGVYCFLSNVRKDSERYKALKDLDEVRILFDNDARNLYNISLRDYVAVWVAKEDREYLFRKLPKYK